LTAKSRREAEAETQRKEKELAKRKLDEEKLAREVEEENIRKAKLQAQEAERKLLQGQRESTILYSELENLVEYGDFDAIQPKMDRYRELTGYYSFISNYYDCPEALKLYVEVEGLDKIEEKDIKTYMYMFLENYIGDYYRSDSEKSHSCCDSTWDIFKQRLSELEMERNIYVDKCNNTKILIEASEVGVKDPNLESAIVKIQRLIRGQDSAIEKVKSSREIDYKHSDFDSEEISIVRWNSHCIPEFISSYIRNNVAHVPFLYGVNSFIFGDTNESLQKLVYDKKCMLFEKFKQYTNSNDAMLKFHYFTSLIGNGDSDAVRCEYRDKLKFLNLTTNTDIKEIVIEEFSRLSLSNMEIVIKRMPFLLSGQSILQTFSKVQVKKLDDSSLRDWFLQIVCDSYDDLVKDKDLSAHRLMKYIELETDSRRARRLCRELLQSYQKVLNEGKPLYPDFRLGYIPLLSQQELLLRSSSNLTAC
jgi:hypothetical protein